MSLLKKFNETKAFQKYSEGLAKINESAIDQNVRPGNSEPPVASVGPNQIDPKQGYKYGRIEDQTNQVPPGNNIIDGKKPTPNSLPPGFNKSIVHQDDPTAQSETDTPWGHIPAAEHLLPPAWKPMLANLNPAPVIRVVNGKVTMEVPTAYEPGHVKSSPDEKYYVGVAHHTTGDHSGDTYNIQSKRQAKKLAGERNKERVLPADHKYFHGEYSGSAEED